ncbi:hypothetical protein D9M71_771580 [compost metagenome]
MKAYLRLLGQRQQRTGIISDDHDMSICGVLKVIEQPFILQQTLNKVEVAFAILSNVAIRFQRFVQAELVLCQAAETCKHLADYVLYCLILEDS